jgi:hypothetical protein
VGFTVNGVLAAAALAVTAPALAADPCQLVPAANVASLLGAETKGVAAGPQKDEDSSGQVSYCTYRGTARPAALVVSMIEFASDAEARKEITRELVESRLGDEEGKIAEEGNVGDKSFYAATDNGSMYIFLKKNRVIGVALGGPGAGDAKATKAALLAVAQAAASRS